MKNKGKIFEESIRNSINKEKQLLIRLNDQPQSFANTAKFSLKNPFDYILYNTIDGKLWCLELKSTSGKSISFEDINSDKEEQKMIHKHQIKSLLEYSKYNGVIAGFLFNFRHFEGEPNAIEMTYFMEINDFQKMCEKINKKSFNEVDAVLNGAVKVHGAKKRTRYTWDVGLLLEQYNKNMNKECK